MVFSLLPTAVLAADGKDLDTSAGSGQVTQQNSENLGDQSEPGNQSDSDNQSEPGNQSDPGDQENPDDLHDSENSDDSAVPAAVAEGGEGATAAAVPELEHPATEGTSGGIDWKVENGTLTISPSSSPEGDFDSGEMVVNYGTLTPVDADYIAALEAAGYTPGSNGHFYYPNTETWVSDSPWKFLSDRITKVVVKDGVTSIAARAFRLPNVTEVSIPASVESIGNLVFESCVELTTVHWTGDWTDHDSMPFNGFSRCSSLGEGYELTDWMPACFYVNADSDSIEGTQFTVDFGKLNNRLENETTYPRAMFRSVPKITSATLTSQLNVDYIFEYSGIQSVTIADDQTSIATAAFRGCQELTSVVIPASVTQINLRAFADSGLKNITFSGSTGLTFGSFAFENVKLDSLTLNGNMSVTEATKIIGELAREGAITDRTTITPAKFANYKAEDVVVDGAEGDAINHQSYSFVKNLTINGAYTSATSAFGNGVWGQGTLKTLTIHAPGEDVTINAMAFLRTPLESVQIEAKKLTFTGDAAFLNTMLLTHIDLTGVGEIVCNTNGKRTFAIGEYQNGGLSAPTRYVYFRDAAAYKAMSSQFGGNTNTYYLVTNDGSVDATKTGFAAVYRAGYTAKWYEDEACTKLVTGNPVTGKIYYVKWTKGAYGGSCGATDEDDVYWTLADNGDGYTLSITGTGAMADYTCNITGSDATQPWRKSMTGVEPTAITKVVVGEGVTNIGNFACDGLSQVKEYNIAASVETIGPWGVCGQNAETYKLNDSTHYKVTKDGVLMSADDKTLVSYPGGKDAVDEYVIPNTVETILAGAFVGSDAKKVVIPSSVTSFPRYSFGGSTVEEIEFNANVNALEGGAFSGLSKLKSLVFGDTTLTTIEGQACSNLSSLTEITFPDSLKTIGAQAFKVLASDGAAAPNLKKVTFGKNMSTIGDVVFLRQSALEVIDMTHCEDLTNVGLFSSRGYDGNEETPYTNTPIVYTADAGAAALVKQNNGNHLIYAVTNGGTFPAGTEFKTGELAQPKKEGFLFLGWYANPDCSGEKVTTAEAGKTYYAKWMGDIPVPTEKDYMKGLVTVKCLNPDWTVGNKHMGCLDSAIGLAQAVFFGDPKPELTQIDATHYTVTYDADAFASKAADKRHSLYSAATLTWTLIYDGDEWKLAPQKKGVDDVVLVTHAPTTFGEVMKFIDGRTDVIKTSCVNGKTGASAFGLMVAFVKQDHVVSVEQEKDSSGQPIRGSYIATLKVDPFAEAGASACNNKNFADSPRAHDVLSKDSVQWRLKVTQAEVSTDAGTEKPYVWSAEPVEAGKDDVCQVAHRVVLTFSYNEYGVKVDDTKVEYTYNTAKIANGTVPTPTREGYIFVQWLDADGNAFDPTAIVTEDHTYDSIEWKPINYRVIFDANAGDKTVTGTMEDQDFTYDQPQTLNANQFVCTNSVFDDRLKQDTQLYEFGGWNTEADGSGDTYADEADFTNKSVTHGERITLYAQWKHVTKTLTYDSKYGTAPSTADVDIFSEVVVAGAPAGFDETKYIFKGWRSNVNGLRVTFQPGDKFDMPNTDVTLTAVWEEIVPAAKANLTYVDTVSDGAADAAETEVGTWVTVKAAPTAVDGKVFKGWKSNIGGTVYQPDNKFQMPATDVVLTAVWEEIVPAVKHKVTYQNENLTYAGDEHEVGSIVKVERPNPPRSGYTFTGWRSSHEGRIYQRGDTFVMPDTDVILTAQWQKNPTEYTVTFLDGNRPVGSRQGVAGSLVLLQDALDKEGYTFVGWKSNVDGKVYEASTRYTMPELNVKMTAVWQADPAKYTVTYDLDGGEGTAPAAAQYVADAFVTVTEETFTKEGFIFAGWRSNVGGTVYRAGDKFQMPASNVVLTAQWQPEEATYAVSTSVNGTVTQIAEGKKANEIYTIAVNDPTKEGYVFTGWLLSSTGTIVHNGDTFNMPAGDVVLTAQWEKEAESYTVTYKNGESSESAGSYKAGAWVTVKEAPVAIEGETFKGWESNVGGTVYQPGKTFKMPDTNVTLTAIWDSETYTITWKNGDAILDKTNVKRGATPEYIGETPTKDATVDKTYTFKGWDPEITAATEDTTYTAQFEEAARTYKITWKDEGGAILKTEQVAYNGMPNFDGTPTKDGDAQYSYTFKGWTPTIAPVTGDAEYCATYTKTVNKYTVKWVIDGTTETQTYEYGKMPAHADPVKPATDDTVYTFKGWTPALSIVTGNVTYTAQFDEITKHTVSYDLDGGESAKPDDAKYAVGSVVTAAGVPTRTGYVFEGWLVSYESKTVNANGTFTMPATDVTLTAQWTPAVQVGDAYIVAADPKLAVHEEVYSDKLTARKADATGAEITSGVKFVLVDDEGHALGTTDLGHDLMLNADGTITGTANGAGTLTFNVRLANLDNEFVSETRTITLVIDKATRNCTVTMEDWTYGEAAKTPDVDLRGKTDGEESYIYFYKVKGAEDSTYTQEVPVNAGDYTVKVVVAESANYKSCEDTADFTIHKALIKSVDPDVTAPVACEAAQSTIANGDGYTGTIAWDPADATFQYSTVYAATVVLTPDSNHKFDNTTTATNGWTLKLNENGTLTLTKVFPETAQDTVKTPVIRPNGGRFYGSETITITCPTDGADIYYTLDGTNPTTDSKPYTGAFKIKESTTVKAIAVKANYIDSAVATAEFTKRTGGNGGGGGGTVVTPVKPSKKDDSLRFNTEDHFAFVNGYPDGTVKPNGNVTRAEVAAILYRVMDADCVKTYETTRCSFSDVVRGDWFNLYVATLENAGVIVDTRTNGKFRPNEAITRAELAAMLAQFADIKSAANSFNDVSARHWASDEIAVCAKMGWINGYPDGSFRPDATITRAEMMAMINRALDRTPKSVSDLLSGMKTWSDNANVNAWYYLDVQEATNSHTYTKSGSHETWKKLR